MCRSFLSPYKDENGNYKFYGRLNQGVVTLNLVDVALSSEGDYEKFWDLMEQRTELCHKALLCRHKRLEGTLSDVAPLLWQYGGLYVPDAWIYYVLDSYWYDNSTFPCK